MKLITIDQARAHSKSAEHEDSLLTVYCNAAEAACERLANRSLFATQAELDTAVAGVTATLTTAYSTYDAAVETANSADDDRIKLMMLAQAQNKLDAATVAADRIIHGMVATDDIIGAILIAVAHFYRNREAVTTDTAVEVPFTTRAIMEENRWLGPL